MKKIYSVFGFYLIVALLAPYQAAGAELTDAEKAESAKIALTVPIADLHDHDGYATSMGQETGVVWSGLGAKKGGRSKWISLKEDFGDKRIAWAGQSEFNVPYLGVWPEWARPTPTADPPGKSGIDEMLNPDYPTLKQLYTDSEKDLKDGLIVGIGEIFINNNSSKKIVKGVKWARKGQVDAPIFRKFFDLVAQYDGFLAFHMQADSDSMDQLGKLLSSNRKGRVVWNHCGLNSSASDVRSMMDKHPNLFCEFSVRYPPKNKEDSREIFNGDGINSSWRELMEDHSDRFMVGTDTNSEKQFVDSIKTVRKGLLPNLKPDTARKIAYQNAQRLFKLKNNP